MCDPLTDKTLLERFFFSFGAGSRTCIGRSKFKFLDSFISPIVCYVATSADPVFMNVDISWMEMSKVTPSLSIQANLTDPASTVDPNFVSPF